MQIPYHPAKCFQCGEPVSDPGAACAACGYDPLKSDEATAGGAVQQASLQDLAESWAGTPTRVWVTPTILGLNVLVFGIMVATGVSFLSPDTRSLTAWGANAGALTVQGQWWRLFTSMFLHIGIIHLACNMAVLWSIGSVVERFLGRTGFAVVYLLAGLCGSLASIAWNPDVVSAGASGAIFGLYGALLGFLLRDRERIPGDVLQKATKNALVFLGYNLVFGLANRGIDVACHVGGLLGGFVCGYAIALPPTPEAMSRRMRTNVRVLAAGTAGVIALAWALPKDRSFQSRFARVETIEAQAARTFDEASARVRAGTLTDAGFADAIENEVLPALDRFQTQMALLAQDPRANTRALAALQRFTDARRDAFWHIAHALRTKDQAEAGEALKQLNEAGRQFQEEVKADGR